MAQAVGEQVAEFDAPAADGLTGDDDASFQQERFDVSIAQRETVVQPDGLPNDLKRESVAGKLLTVEHRVTLLQQLATTGQRYR